MKKKGFAFCIALISHASSNAACFQPDPYLPPSADTKAFIGYEPEWLSRFGGDPHVQDRIPYPPPLPLEMLGQENKGSMPVGATGHIAYYERAPNKGMRICRVDYWWAKQDEPDETRKKMLEKSQRFASGHKLLESLVQNKRVLMSSTRYVYDDKNRVVRVEEALFTDPENSALRVTDCRRYDEKDRVVLWVSPKETNMCPDGDPSPNDTWRQFKYADVNGEEVQLLQRWHVAKKGGKWQEEWSPIRLDATPSSVRGYANADSRRGVKEIYGSTFGERDNNAANMVVDVFGHWNGSTYYFTRTPVPVSVLSSSEELYKYERRRMTRLDNHTRMYELFKPNEHISRHRFYMLAGVVLRHDQLDEKGKMKRIVTVNDWRQPRPGATPDFDDKLLKTSSPRLIGHQVYHRVYEVDAGGRPTLVALSWNRALRNPVKSIPLSMADLVFGTPDGKVKWKSRDEFDKAFDTSENARQVFPDRPGEDDEDSD